MDESAWAVEVPAGYRVDDWEIVGRLATGSWSSVYRGRRVTTPAPLPAHPPEPASDVPREAALKFLPTGTLSSRQLAHMAAMTTRELNLHRKLSHVRLIRLFETLTVDDPQNGDLDGATVLVLEMAQESLNDLLRRGDGPVGDAGRLIVEICEGLAFLHSQSWVHGDLKPANVLLMTDGSVRLADFGLATEIDGTHGYLPRTGSPDFMPSERVAQPLTERGFAVRTTLDIWALGVTAHLMLTGRHPFPGTTVRARASAIAEYAAGQRSLLLDPDLSAGWRAFVADCLAPDHETRRHHDAAGLLDRARQLAAVPHDTDPPPDRPGHDLPELRRSSSDRLVPWRRPARRVASGRAQRLTLGNRLALAGGVAAVATAITVSVVVAGDSGSTSTLSAEQRSDGADANALAVGQPPDGDGGDANHASRWLNTNAGIPEEYLDLIIEAGTMCDEPGISPALVAAMLEAESGFDPDLSDPANDEYGIARWTPRVLQYYLPPGSRDAVPSPPFPPEVSIPAVGRYLCVLGPQLETVPGKRELLLAAAYRRSAEVVRAEGGVPARNRPYTDQVAVNLVRYAPSTPPG